MRVLVTGGAGFIGSAIVRAGQARGHAVRFLTRGHGSQTAGAIHGDLRHIDLSTLVAAFDVVIHAASQTDGTATNLWENNVDTTHRLARAVTAHGTRFIAISTTGVYGRSSGNLGGPTTRRRNPTSDLSKARAAAEDLVWAAGGSVIRPHIVFGAADRWVIPPLVSFMHAAGAWLGSDDVEVAAISVERLADAVVGLVGRDLPPVLHAAEPQPVPVADLVRPAFQASSMPLPSRAISINQAYALVRGTGVSRNALEMVGMNSTMDSAALWDLAAATRGTAPRSS